MSLQYNGKSYKTITGFNNARKRSVEKAFNLYQNALSKKLNRDEINKYMENYENIYEQNRKITERQEHEKYERKIAFKQRMLNKKTYNQLPFYVSDVQKPVKQTREQRLLKDGLKVRNELIYGERVAYTKALQGAFKDIVLENYKISETEWYYLPDSMVDEKRIWTTKIKDLLNHEWGIRDKNKGMLVYIIIAYVCLLDGGLDENDNRIFQEVPLFFHSKTRNILNGSNDEFTQYLLKENAKFIEQLGNDGPSSLIFSHINYVEIKISKTKPTQVGGSYIELPLHIKNKQCCINFKNTDERCFEHCLIAHEALRLKLFTARATHELNRYKKFSNLIKIPDNVEYPVKHLEAQRYALLNDMKINIFELDENNIVHLLSNDIESRNTNVCNLLLIHNKEKTKSHYVLIRNLNPLLPQYNSNSKTKYNNSKFTCPQCLSVHYNSKERLEAHIKLCMNHESVKVEMPQKGGKINKTTGVNNHEDKLKFKNYGHSFKHPYFIVADFESTLLKVDIKQEKTIKYQKHVANSFGIKYNCIHNEHSEMKIIYNNEDEDKVIENFILELERLAKKSYDLTKLNIKTIKYKNDEKKQHMKCSHCSSCHNEFTKDNYKVAHHDHISGEFIGSLCNNCNLQLQYDKFIPVIIHNLKGYDCHLFVRGLAKYGYKHNDMSNIKCIPNNEERYISISKVIKVDTFMIDGVEKNVYFEIRFIDSIAFMNSSLDTLVNNLKSNETNISKLREIFKYTSEEYDNDEKFLNMIQKGIYPYDWVDSYDKMNYPKLPERKHFYSKLNNTEITIADEIQSKKVWDLFNCSKFLDYHNLYLTSDVLLLSDVWDNFTNTLFKSHKLDCNYYFTLPSFSWDCFLLTSKCEIDLLTDHDMYLFFENGIRGGISQISHRYSEANNKYMKNYNKDIEDKYLIYLDSNNLYGEALGRYVPYKNFKWNTEEWTTEKILNLKDEADKGYTFEVDLEYPVELHDLHNNYPLCPESLTVKKQNLNLWQQENYKESNVKKLILSLNDKNNYVVHYRYLKLVLSLGLKLKKVHRVIEYTQGDIIKKYIELNTNLRKKASNDFEKDLYKLCNNAIFGKTMENIRNRINFTLINNENTLYNMRNDVKRHTIFSEDLVGVHQNKRSVKLNKPVFIGQGVLDDSKRLMANFHYNFMLKKVERNNINLCFTDTDSLCYEIKHTDVFEIMKNNLDEFDTSDYPKDHFLYSEINKKVIGKMKNESVKPITHFCGLRSKMYSFLADGDDKKHNKLKGVKKYVAKTIKFEQYKNTCLNQETITIQQNGIRSYKHQIYTETQFKTGLSYNDDKVFICSDNIHTYNHGHYKIKTIQLYEELPY